MSVTLVDAAAGVLLALSLVEEGPWLLGFAGLALLRARGWPWEVLAAAALAGEGAARRFAPSPAEREAMSRLSAVLLGLAAIGVAFGATVGVAAWWAGPGRGAKQDAGPALRAVARRAGLRAVRALVGLAMIFAVPLH